MVFHGSERNDQQYTVSGMLIPDFFQQRTADVITGVSWNPGFVSLLGITVVAALMYVCASGIYRLLPHLLQAEHRPELQLLF